jgi:toxin ParE1/3/4
LGRFLGQREREANAHEFMTPIWSPESIADLVALRAYIAQDDPAAAQRIALHIIRNVETLLSNSPAIGRPGRVPGTRELVIPKTPYIVPYRLVGNAIQILRVFHSARQWPETF